MIYWESPTRSNWQNHIVQTDKGSMGIREFSKTSAERVLREDKDRQREDRKNMWYMAYLDQYTDWYNARLDKLSHNEGILFDAIVRVYFQTDPALKWLNWLERRTEWNGWNPAFFNKLKEILDNNISFIGVNQTDLAALVWARQNEITQAFNSLIRKGFLHPSSTDGKKKFFAISDIDILGFYALRYM